MRSARSSMLLAMTLLAPAFAATPASAQSIAFVSDLVGDPSLDSVADLIGDPSSEFLADPMADPSADVVAGPPLELAVAPALAGPRPMTDDDLAEARGGFMTAGGFTFNFGVVVRSYINDALALQTQLTWTPTGPVTEQTHHSVPGVEDLAVAMADLAAGGIDLAGLQNVGGVAVVDTDGATAILHNITTSQLQNLIINNADNRNIRQDMELNLILPDLATIQMDSRMQNYGSHILRDIDWAGLRGLGF